MSELIEANGPIPSNFLRRTNGSAASENERQVLDIVLREESVTRADITRLSGLTAQSISRLVEALEGRGFVRHGERVIKGRGQPSRFVELIPDAAYTIGLSIMTDCLNVVLMDFSCEVVEEIVTPIGSMEAESVVSCSKDILQSLLDQHVHDRRNIFGIGVSIAGYFVGEGRQVNTPQGLEDWALIDLEKMLSDHFRLPVWIENDGNAAAIGESLVGAGSWAKSFVYLYFAAGFGGGLVINGKPLRGSYGNAGELGGFLPEESYASPNLSLLREMISDAGTEFGTLNNMLRDFRLDMPGIDQWIETVSPSLSLIASAAAVMIDPDAIVLGGRIPSQLANALIPRIKIHNSGRRSRPRPEPRIIASEAKHDAAAIGAASLPLKQHFFL